MDYPIIEIENLSLLISNKLILNTVSLQIFEGNYLSIIGPNGAGKTSLLKCLMRIYSEYSGTIKFKGKSLKKISQKNLAKQISYVPQANGRVFPFTVEEFVMMGRYPHLSPFTSFREEDKKAVREALEITKTTSFSKRQIHSLSGGEKQTVYIAAALAQGSKIMLLDEPTTFLDPKHETEIYRILKRLNKDLKITIATVTHDINNAALQSDRIFILKNGEMIFSGNASEIMKNKILERAYDKPFTFLNHPVTGQVIAAPDIPDY